MAATTEVIKRRSLPVGQHVRPQVNLQQAVRMTEKLYGIQVTSIKELDSYCDRNFHIKISESHSNPHLTWSRHGYVLKVLNSMDSKKQHVDAEHEVQRLLHLEGISCPQPVLNIYGKEKDLQDCSSSSPEEDSSQSGANMVRLLTFVPGETLHSVQITAGLLQDLGRTLARIHTVLGGYNHPALGVHPFWSLSSIPIMRQFIHAVQDKQRQDMVLAIVDNFELDVLVHENSFRKGIIHGDLSPYNTLVTSTTPNDGSQDLYVCGVLDFGHVQESYLFYDLSIAITYALVSAGDLEEEQVSQVAAHLVRGYLAGQKLWAVEWEALPLTICARMAQSLVMGAYSYSLNPDNDYLLITAASGWPLLKMLWTTPAATWRRAWADVCKQHGCYLSFDDN